MKKDMRLDTKSELILALDEKFKGKASLKSYAKETFIYECENEEYEVMYYFTYGSNFLNILWKEAKKLK